MAPSLLQFLSENPLFKSLSRDEIEQLEGLISEEHIAAGRYVFLEEELAHYFYILKEGELRAMIGGKLLASIKPGQVFGELAVLNSSLRTGSVFTEMDSTLVKIDGRVLFDGKTIPVDIAFRVLKETIKPLISLQYTNDLYKKSKDLITQGESDKVEFKSTLRYNIHTGKFGREIEHAALKTIAAFLNSWGGILIVGIDDKQKIIGIEQDNFENDDKSLLYLTQIVKERLGTHFMQFIICNIEVLEGKKIMRIDVNPADRPAFLTQNNDEYFYIRTGPSTTDLKPSLIHNYIDNRFYRPRA